MQRRYSNKAVLMKRKNASLEEEPTKKKWAFGILLIRHHEIILYNFLRLQNEPLIYRDVPSCEARIKQKSEDASDASDSDENETTFLREAWSETLSER